MKPKEHKYTRGNKEGLVMIECTVPAPYTISGWSAVAVIQKTEEDGYISVSIKEGDELLDSQSTSTSYGVVTVGSG